ncbi:hypothetical protein BJV78DRAFT_633665 [Lactifluus subvellereus]|nr:hypothetical protein BJV78DRAFT_633665 [Lactifluus subvellereus]
MDMTMSHPSHPCFVLAMPLCCHIILVQVALLVPPPRTCNLRAGPSRCSSLLRSRLIPSPRSTLGALRRRRAAQAQYCPSLLPLPLLPPAPAQIPVGTGMAGTIMRSCSLHWRHSSRSGRGARVGGRATCSRRTTLWLPYLVRWACGCQISAL